MEGHNFEVHVAVDDEFVKGAEIHGGPTAIEAIEVMKYEFGIDEEEWRFNATPHENPDKDFPHSVSVKAYEIEAHT